MSQRLLESGPRNWFADWPIEAGPRHAACVYTVWDHTGGFIYVGMAGRGMSGADIANHRTEGGRPRGLWERLNSHASGRRSGDQFCVYVADRLVLPNLDADQVEAIATGDLTFDSLVRSYIRSNLAFRFCETADGTEALQVEREIQRGPNPFGSPLLNPSS